jgi:hypothetical protein
MVSRKDKNQATKFICDILDASNQYDIQSCDHEQVTVKEQDDMRDRPRTIQVIMANFHSPVKKYNGKINQNFHRGIYTAPIFYKDGKTAFVRAVDGNAWRRESTLKNYSDREINQMLNLRKLESSTMQRTGDTLIYYQPKTDRLVESIRHFEMGPVTFDYSHVNGPEYDSCGRLIKEAHPSFGFVSGTEVSKLLKFPMLQASIDSAAEFKFDRPRKLARIYSLSF